MTPTPREVPVWPHRPTTNWSDTSAESVCIACGKPWGDKGCPSQQYLDGLVEAVRALLGVAFRDDDFLTQNGIPMTATPGVRRELRALRLILEGARATDDEGQRERG